MSKPKTISVAMLKRAGACGIADDYTPIFGARREIPMTQTLARIIAVALGRADWVADKIMTQPARDAYYARVLAINPAHDYWQRAHEKGDALFVTYQPRKFRK